MNKDGWGLSRSQRMRLKALICVLGLILILILLMGKLILMLVSDDEEKEEPHIPVIEYLTNVWIMETDDSGVLIYEDGISQHYSYGVIAVTGAGEKLFYRPMQECREQVADVELTDGRVTAVSLKNEKISGRVLAANAETIEIEGYGILSLASDYKGYRLYDSLQMCSIRDLFFGYDFADFCMENGKVCAILMVKEAAMENIRVLIKASDYSALLHEQPVITSDVSFTVEYGSYDNPVKESYMAGTELVFGGDSPYFEQGRVRIVPDVLTGKVIIKNCNRNQGTPAYRGQVELLKTQEGVAIINELPLEEYLYSVVPSEMPSNYPKEALKAQAICARTYAYGHMERAGYPQYGAHVDDSTSYQVYNNVREQESTTTAVKETYGQLLFTKEEALAGTYYYSTSCGVGSDPNVWKTAQAPTLTYLDARTLNKTDMANALAAPASQVQSGQTQDVEMLREEDVFRAFITTVNENDFEVSEGWYRWKYRVEELDYDRILEMLQKRFNANNELVLTWEKDAYVSKEIKKLDGITAIYIEKRGGGGVADELVIETKSQKIKVISEHNIRYVLNNGESKVERHNGSEIASPNLLPSGFFVIDTITQDKEVTGYLLTGGGFGHGVGMSQNGAKEMAKSGYTAGDILLYFYDNCAIRNVYE